MSSPQRDEVSAQGLPGNSADAGGAASGGDQAAGSSPAAPGGQVGGGDPWAKSSPPGPGGWAANGPVPGGGAAGSGAAGSGADGGPPPGARNPWKATKDGRTVFRRGTPFVLWWIWIAFAIFNVVQVVIPDHDYFSLELTAGLLAVTGLAYATALRPRVIASDDGLVVHNPVRDHLARWGAVSAVYLGDSVELSCARQAPRKDKTVYCWALYSNRRARMKQSQLGMRSWLHTSNRAPAEARELASQDSAQLMAAELGRRATGAREAGAPAAVLESRWAWWPIAAMLVPAAALIGLLVAK